MIEINDKNPTEIENEIHRILVDVGVNPILIPNCSIKIIGAFNKLYPSSIAGESIERAKIAATKRIKMVIESSLKEYEKAEKNGRCVECKDPLTWLESRDGNVCGECLLPC